MSVPVLSVAQMREWEKATWASGQTEAEVIRRVGEQVAMVALKLAKPGDSILILAGKGHNGDDARAAQNHLAGRQIELLEVKNPDQDFPELEDSLSHRPALVIDGLFGVGLNRPLDDHWKKIIQRINDSRLKVLSVDTPSGLSAETGEPQGAAIEASVTLTVGAPKTGLLRQQAWPFVGRLEVAANVGLVPGPLTSELNWTLPGDFSAFPPGRPVASHKGSFGHLAILAGSLGFHGAAVMAARAAQRARPGLITLFTQENVYEPVASQLRAVMVHPWSPKVNLPGDFKALL
ncbi:MAG TPA: NAD(P)H-hydrate epimerase, partial [Verrucomicrobiae bacterium]|nr:NAD(P)H-hydrate epimerase [Verrucomicrobiae bacterium]